MRQCILYWFILLPLLACNSGEQPPETSVTAPLLQPQTGLAISEDREKLGQLIDLKGYPPTGVTFQWNGRDRDGLEAVLYYNEQTYGAILDAYMEAGFPKGRYTKEQFDFSWLDSTQQAELQFSKPDYTGNPDVFLGTGGKGMLWFLDKKILLKITP